MTNTPAPPGAIPVGFFRLEKKDEMKKLRELWGCEPIEGRFINGEYWIPCKPQGKSSKDKKKENGTKKHGPDV
jgi:hypothetical protein